MTYNQLLDGMKRFGSNERDIYLYGIGVPPERVNANVIIAPWWEPSILPDLGEAEYLGVSEFSAIKVWDISNNGLNITYIKTGIGAPVLMDVILSLGGTKCKQALFIGSVGSLDECIGIGDIVIPEWSICGDGASRYIASTTLKDVFGEKAYPNHELYLNVLENAKQVCANNDVKCHVGHNFSIDTIFAQYAHIDFIKSLGCNVIEMETAAAFRAAQISGIALAAIFSVSDNTVARKSLISGRTEKEKEYRKFTRRTVFPEIILKYLKN